MSSYSQDPQLHFSELWGSKSCFKVVVFRFSRSVKNRDLKKWGGNFAVIFEKIKIIKIFIADYFFFIFIKINFQKRNVMKEFQEKIFFFK